LEKRKAEPDLSIVVVCKANKFHVNFGFVFLRQQKQTKKTRLIDRLIDVVYRRDRLKVKGGELGELPVDGGGLF
jgi:hypothetical protein